MQHYAGVDLHSNNNYLGIIDQKDRKVHRKKLPNKMPEVLKELEPYRDSLEGIVVESTFNWYWLVDGLMESGYKVHLANPCAIKQYDGLKHSDDIKDSFHLATLLKLGILPEGYIYPKEERAVRDLLRKRLMLVRHKTAHILSFQSLANRNLAVQMDNKEVASMSEEDVEEMFTDTHLVISGKANIAAVRFLIQRIQEIEKAVIKVARLKEEYRKLLTVPGIGKILALTIMFETGDIRRFREVGNYASYCRCVGSSRLSNGKKKGTGNRKNGNKYLSWAYVEAANFAVWRYPYILKYYQRKMSRTNKIVAIKTIAHKLSRASYYVIKNQEVFDPQRAFG